MQKVDCAIIGYQELQPQIELYKGYTSTSKVGSGCASMSLSGRHDAAAAAKQSVDRESTEH